MFVICGKGRLMGRAESAFGTLWFALVRFDSRFVSLLFPTDDCVGKSLRSTVEICHVEGALRFVGHLHLLAEWYVYVIVCVLHLCEVVVGF